MPRARQTTIVLGTLSNATRVFKNGVSQEIRQIENKGAARTLCHIVDVVSALETANVCCTSKRPCRQKTNEENPKHALGFPNHSEWDSAGSNLTWV